MPSDGALHGPARRHPSYRGLPSVPVDAIEPPTCPRCGRAMCVLRDSAATNGGVITMDAICENCLHVMTVSFLVVREGEK